MLKISDKGLKDFEEEYKQIMVRKLKYGNAYNKNILTIKHYNISNLIEKNIDAILYSEEDRMQLEKESKKLLMQMLNLTEEDFQICEILVTTNKEYEILKEKLKKDTLKKIKKKKDRVEYLKQNHTIFYESINEYESINKIFNNENIKKINEQKEKYDDILKRLELIIKNSEECTIAKNSSKFIEKLLVSNCYCLRNIIDKINSSSYKDELKVTFKNFFDYTKYIDSDLRNTILNKIGINVCPYCGRQFISSYIDSGKFRNSAELDHFFSKSKYPYLALSLYNFIPSCHICNSRNKGNVDFNKMEHLYPYMEGFENDAKFDIDHSILITDIISGKEKAKIMIRTNGNTKINNNKKTFKLESLYQNHSKDVQNIFSMIQVYNKSYLEDIANILYVKEIFNDKISSIENKISNNNDIEDSEKDIFKDEFNELRKMDMAMKAEDLILLLFKEKDNDEILSKLYNDLIDKYWRMK